MRRMDFCGKFCSILVISLSLIPYALTNGKMTRHNGTDWIHFGAGVINSSKMIKVSLVIDDQDIDKIIVDSKKLSEIKKWITENFKEKLNFSPVHPRYKSWEFQNLLILYSENIEDDENLLLMIPLNDRTVCPRLKEYIQKLKELKSIVEKKP